MTNFFFMFLYALILISAFAGTDLYMPNSHTLSSLNEIVSFTDPFTGKIWYEGDIKGSIILSWKNDVKGVGGGFCNIVLHTSLHSGGRFEISLLYVIESDQGMINGIWSITKNDEENKVYRRGTIINLGYPIGHTIELKLSELNLKARISFKCSIYGHIPLISGQIKRNDIGINDALVILKQNDSIEDILPTYGNGNYEFLLITSDNLESLTINFPTTVSTESLSGHIYILGMPWENADVEFRINSQLFDTTSTNDDGYFEFSLTNYKSYGEDNKDDFIDIIIDTSS